MRPALMRALRHGCVGAACLCALSCGGGGNSLTAPSNPVTPAANNVVSVAVNGGPAALNYPAINVPYTTVTVCVPGSTTQCQTVDNVLVDTGSYGLRLLAPALTLSLPVAAAADGNALAECTVFADGYSWGPVAAADVHIAGELASSVPVQLIGDSRLPTVPSDCASTGSEEDTVAAFGANGVLGIGPFIEDCPECAANAIAAAYYSCTTAGCSNITAGLGSQVQNPVPLFSADNNGTIIVLPAVGAGGAASVTGSLIFGIDTESNNQSGTQTVLTLQTSGVNIGDLTTIFNGQTLSASFIDSGSNANYFNDSNIGLCSGNFAPFYCPASAVDLSATLQGANGVSIAESFSVANAQMIPQGNFAFPGFAGTTSTAGSFDWGLPFFYGRRVATAIEGYTTSAGTGPYVAF
ncbi:MAG: DUF3443 domain-containing protein [Steroidobacteraceae bacterium]